jgi:hypothetical protein
MATTTSSVHKCRNQPVSDPLGFGSKFIETLPGAAGLDSIMTTLEAPKDASPFSYSINTDHNLLPCGCPCTALSILETINEEHFSSSTHEPTWAPAILETQNDIIYSDPGMVVEETKEKPDMCRLTDKDTWDVSIELEDLDNNSERNSCVVDGESVTVLSRVAYFMKREKNMGKNIVERMMPHNLLAIKKQIQRFTRRLSGKYEKLQ